MFNIFNDTDIDLQELESLMHDFMPFAQERFGFKKPPSLFFKSDAENASDCLGKTAHYNPHNFEITIFVDGRHPKDILRSFAHELVHHGQNERGDFTNILSTDLGYAQKDPHMREMEREAYEQGNLCFRDWEDSKKTTLQETIYYTTILTNEENDMSKKTLNEWKNVELNKLLMRRFGLVSEQEETNNENVDPAANSDAPNFRETDSVQAKSDDEEEEEDEDEDSSPIDEELTYLNNEIDHILNEGKWYDPSEWHWVKQLGDLPIAGGTSTAAERSYIEAPATRLTPQALKASTSTPFASTSDVAAFQTPTEYGEETTWQGQKAATLPAAIAGMALGAGVYAATAPAAWETVAAEGAGAAEALGAGGEAALSVPEALAMDLTAEEAAYMSGRLAPWTSKITRTARPGTFRPPTPASARPPAPAPPPKPFSPPRGPRSGPWQQGHGAPRRGPGPGPKPGHAAQAEAAAAESAAAGEAAAAQAAEKASKMTNPWWKRGDIGLGMKGYLGYELARGAAEHVGSQEYMSKEEQDAFFNRVVPPGDEQLDTNKDGYVSEEEEAAYDPSAYGWEHLSSEDKERLKNLARGRQEPTSWWGKAAARAPSIYGGIQDIQDWEKELTSPEYYATATGQPINPYYSRNLIAHELFGKPMPYISDEERLIVDRVLSARILHQSGGAEAKVPIWAMQRQHPQNPEWNRKRIAQLAKKEWHNLDKAEKQELLDILDWRSWAGNEAQQELERSRYGLEQEKRKADREGAGYEY